MPSGANLLWRLHCFRHDAKLFTLRHLLCHRDGERLNRLSFHILNVRKLNRHTDNPTIRFIFKFSPRLHGVSNWIVHFIKSDYLRSLHPLLG